MSPRLLIVILAITLGLPFLMLLAIVSSGSGVHSVVFTNALTIAVLSAFLALMISEIKRVAELPPEKH